MIFTNTKIKKIAVCACELAALLFALLQIFLGSETGALYTSALASEDTLAVVLTWCVLGLMAVSSILSLVAMTYQLFGKKVKVLLLANSIVALIALVLSVAASGVNAIYVSISFGLNLLGAIYATVFEIKNKGSENEEEDDGKGAIFGVVFSLVSLMLLFSLFFIPVCYYDDTPYFALFDALKGNASLECLISFLSFFVIYILLLVYFTNILVYSKDTQRFVKKTRGLIYWEFALSIAFFIFSIVISFVDRNNLGTVPTSVSSFAYVPLLAMAAVTIAHSLMSSRYLTFNAKEKDNAAMKLKNRIIALVFTLLFCGLLVGSVFSNVLVIQYTSSGVTNTTTVNGFEVLSNYQNKEAAYKLLAFYIYLILVYGVCMLVFSLSLFFRKSSYFYKFSFVSICVAFVLTLTLAMFGKYYEIGEGIQAETIRSILLAKGISLSIDYETKVTSQTIYFAMASLALFVAMIAFKPFSNRVKEDALDVNINNDLSSLNSGVPAIEGKPKENEKKEEAHPDFDPCPAFSEIDAKEKEYLDDLKDRENQIFDNPTLPSITNFIVEYARDSRLHLSYQPEDIAQFIAGLGSSKLSILQGMSGTGKTSLPKIFSEAIFGNCDIVEVESSWKDKNELIGYYNEFSSKFTPKKFTQALYKAKFTPEEITFIVLDEMNLSRIEYYFSDFLSLMENEEDKRSFKLLNVPLRVMKDGKSIDFKQLEDGHTIKIPANVWFIGTANRDESTFEISDKVYDRAMTMNFTKRAPKVKSYNSPISQRFLTYDAFNDLIQNAKGSYKFDCESNETVKAVEALVAPYNISFGNRILNQIESFVSVYCSCFNEPEAMEQEALEKILLTKVVQKLEVKSIENKEELAHSFEKIGLMRCAEFINKLNEDI